MLKTLVTVPPWTTFALLIKLTMNLNYSYTKVSLFLKIAPPSIFRAPRFPIVYFSPFRPLVTFPIYYSLFTIAPLFLLGCYSLYICFCWLYIYIYSVYFPLGLPVIYFLDFPWIYFLDFHLFFPLVCPHL